MRTCVGVSETSSSLSAYVLTRGTPGYTDSCAKGTLSPKEVFLFESSMEMSVGLSVSGIWVWLELEFMLRKLIALRTLRMAEAIEKSTKSIRNVGKHAAINAREHSTIHQY